LIMCSLQPSIQPGGLMKAMWDRSDYEAMNQNHLHFSTEQTRQMRSSYVTAGRAVMNPEPLKLAIEVEHD
jgi:hypothetical protein